MSAMTQAFLTSESQVWATPWCVIRALEAWEGFRFTLDVAASEKSAKANKFYTEEDNAFQQNWWKDVKGGDAFINPPYGDRRYPVKEWAEHAWCYRSRINMVLLLPANKTDQDWFHDLVLPYGQYMPVRGRIGFLNPETGESHGGNSQGSMLVIFGPNRLPCAPRTFDYKKAKQMFGDKGSDK